MMWRILVTVAVLVFLAPMEEPVSQEKDMQKGVEPGTPMVSFKQQVFPIIKRHCLPCHAEENLNPSELSLDSYDGLMAGGKHGPAVAAKRSQESLIIAKLGPKPPFGDRMPLDPRKKRGGSVSKKLTDEEIKAIGDWIDQGAKKN